MTTKTYGVSGFIDWSCNIKSGSVELNVNFHGGALTAYGVTPAKYTTSNAIYQFIIERSRYFQNGTIFILREHTDNSSEISNKNTSHVDNEDSRHNHTSDNTNVVDSVEEKSVTENENVIEVADKNEAVEYLKEHCDASLTATKLRSQSAFDAACAKHNVKFIFTE